MSGNLYVAMSRGRHTNHAYVAVQGEQTAQDIFVQCLVSDWIDQPAHIRRAELAGQQPHRTGLLDGNLLRSLLDRRHQLVSDLELAEARQKRLPGEIRHTQTEKATAERTIADLQQRQQQAEDLIAEYDRPLRRHRHEADITNARNLLADLPHQLHPAQQKLTAANDTLADLDAATTASWAVLARRSDIEGEIGDLDDRIDHDLRIRTRVARREQPESIIAVLGPRAAIGQDTRSWDTAAGRLAQHQAAFNLDDGLWAQSSLLHPPVFAASCEAVARLTGPLAPPDMQRSIELEGLGIEF